MFKFLRKKIKDTVSSLSKKIDEEGTEEVKEIEESIEEKKEEPKRKGFFKRLFGKKEKISEKESIEEEKEIEEKIEEAEKEIVEEIPEEKEFIGEEPEVVEEEEKPIGEEVKIREEPSEEKIEKPVSEEQPEITKKKIIEKEEIKKEKKIEPEELKKSFFGKIKQKIITKKINENQFDKIFWDLEVALMENNVAVEVIEKIKTDLKQNIVDKPLRRGKIEEIITNSLKNSIKDLFNVDKINLLERIKEKKPYVICFVGINGSGKTTTIAKIAKLLLDKKLKVILAASDTFRAASIEQLQIHADRLGIKMIKQDYGSDPAAVAYDAIAHAKAKNADVVLIDTAGRMHSNVNLEDEMKKIVRVAKPDLKIFVGESITGNDCVEQAKRFNESIDIDAIILAKADVDEKGGAAVSVSYVTKKPIMFIGTGQEYSDLKEFDSRLVVESLGLSA